MPLFNESIESIAQAIATLNRALEYGVIEEQNYKGLNEYLEKQKNVFKVKKSHLEKANRDLDDELQSEVEEFFMDEGDALYKMSEELLSEHEKGFEKDDDELLREEEKLAYEWRKQSDACKAWAIR